jgi:hypothetical protein
MTRPNHDGDAGREAGRALAEGRYAPGSKRSNAAAPIHRAGARFGHAVAGLIGSAEAAQPLVQAATAALVHLRRAYPTQKLSPLLRSVGAILLVAHLAGGLHLASVRTAFSSAISTTDLLVLAAWGLGAVAFAGWRFSWLPGTAAT